MTSDLSTEFEKALAALKRERERIDRKWERWVRWQFPVLTGLVSGAGVFVGIQIGCGC